MKRRQFVQITGVTPLALHLSLEGLYSPLMAAHDHFNLPPLPYPPDALEPVIDKQTMEIHHGKHHKGYVDNLNKALDAEGIHTHNLEELLQSVSKRTAVVRNNAGGHWNHSFFWTIMRSPRENNMPEGLLTERINTTFGSFSNFQDAFKKAALGIFGSGWAWLIKTPSDKLVITTTPNQDNPLMDLSQEKGTPVLGIDVWEHAYYLKYQNRRSEYLDAWWKVVNWDQVGKRLFG